MAHQSHSHSPKGSPLSGVGAERSPGGRHPSPSPGRRSAIKEGRGSEKGGLIGKGRVGGGRKHSSDSADDRGVDGDGWGGKGGGSNLEDVLKQHVRDKCVLLSPRPFLQFRFSANIPIRPYAHTFRHRYRYIYRYRKRHEQSGHVKCFPRG
jgi:hypothetical protein